MIRRSLEPDLLPSHPEARALAEAERLARARVNFVRHAVIWGMCFLFFTFVADLETGVTLALLSGIFLAPAGYKALIAPRLERKWAADEFASRMQRPSSPERTSIESQHARALETLSASIAHEIRNPITAAKSLVQQMGEDPRSEDNIEYARVAIEELARVERSISHLLRYAREEPLTLGPVMLKDIVTSAFESFHDRAQKSGVALVSSIDERTSLRGDAEKLRRIVINLVANAIDVLEATSAPAPRVEVSAGQNLAGTEVWLKVTDNGPGVTNEVAERLFTPFFTSKANGTGLGLAITKKLVEAHRGRIEMRSHDGAGTQFEVTLPTGLAP